mmetsp:Transcript_22629/g.38377  ORF Transcript_22629/g.38377 Transcript_22629/m.38377 type:complete len:101 (+) Transcript_22629:525-827(+)
MVREFDGLELIKDDDDDDRVFELIVVEKNDDGVFELIIVDNDGVVCVTMFDDGVVAEVGVSIDLVDVSLLEVVVAVFDVDGVVSCDSTDVVAESSSSKFT